MRLTEGLDVALGTTAAYVAYVDGTDERPEMKISPLHVGEVLAKNVWNEHTAVLTSATVPTSMPDRVGLPAEGTEVLTVDSPFDYERNSRLYCSPEFPEWKSPKYSEFLYDEMEALITAAGGRTLALFTSNKALHAATDAMRERLDFPILSPKDYPRQKLIEMFMADESSCLFASQSFFQGVDLPGRTLSLVILDKLPFPLPNDPLLEARREAVGRDKAFGHIDLPIAATSLAQAAGRLIRTATDQGVVAVFDNRLASARYRWTLLNALPPMKKTRNRDEVEQFLRDITQEK
jgi:ATP-dependent DNA helicase DinG